jgi:hypothetical protein
MRDRGLLVALTVCLLIELLGRQFAIAATDPSDPDEILLEAMGVSPVHKVVSWQIPSLLRFGKSTTQFPSEAKFLRFGDSTKDSTVEADHGINGVQSGTEVGSSAFGAEGGNRR